MLDNARTQNMQLGLAYIKHSYTPLLFIGWILAALSKNWLIRLDEEGGFNLLSIELLKLWTWQARQCWEIEGI